jgi:dTDP-4-amino-4,6-dideoxygalactose transaminase
MLENRFLDVTGLEGLAVATSSGRTALSLALRALKHDKPNRDQVIIPSYSCRGLLDPIIENGLTPVYADVGDDLDLTEATVISHLSTRTLAIVVVHLGGKYATEVEAIARRAEQNGIVLVEDLCQALGGRTRRSHWGASAPMTIYSFGLGKNLMATAGGMLVARIAHGSVQAEKERLACEKQSYPCARFSYVVEAHLRTGPAMVLAMPSMPVEAFQSSYGYNRISVLDAQLMNYQLQRIDEILSARKRNAHILLDALNGSSRLLVPGKDGASVWTKFITVADTAVHATRIRRVLHRAGIETETMYTPLHLVQAGEPFTESTLPVTERIYRRAFNLPVRPSIGSDQMAYIARTIQRAVSV